MREIIRKIVMVIALAVFCISLFQLVSIFLAYKKSADSYEAVKEEYVSEVLVEGQVMGDLEAPAVVEYQVDFARLIEANPDCIGWIYIEGTNVDYPIVQGDDNDYYLHHTFTGEKNASGAIFMEAVLEEQFDAQNVIIYGHNMRDKSMFATLHSYRKEDFFAEQPYIQVYTPEGNYTYEIFAAFTVKPSRYDTYQYAFASDDSFEEYINKIKSYSDHQKEMEILPDDQLITLSTCTGSDADRFVVVGKLVK